MAQNKIIKSIPKSEKISVKIHNEKEELTHIITEKIMSASKEFVMYKVEKDKTYTLLGKSNNPKKLEEKYVDERKEIE